MSRLLLILVSDTIKQKAKKWIETMPYGTSVEFREPRRTTDQNAKMWAMLTDISKQVLHRGELYPPEDWKLLFLWALGQEMRFIPALDGSSFVPVGLRSSHLSKSEMSDLIELIASEGAKRGVIFHEHKYEKGADDVAATDPGEHAQ